MYGITTTPEQTELMPLKELFGELEETEVEALERLDDSDYAEAPQAIGSVVWTVRVRCYSSDRSCGRGRRREARAPARSPQAALVAPATANLLAKLAAGIADDLLTTVLLAFEGPVVLAPALAPEMADKPATRRNLETLVRDGYGIVPTMQGLEAATSERAEGGMADALTAFAYLKRFALEHRRAAA
jgi:hypothetical protein